MFIVFHVPILVKLETQHAPAVSRECRQTSARLQAPYLDRAVTRARDNARRVEFKAVYAAQTEPMDVSSPYKPCFVQRHTNLSRCPLIRLTLGSHALTTSFSSMTAAAVWLGQGLTDHRRSSSALVLYTSYQSISRGAGMAVFEAKRDVRDADK